MSASAGKGSRHKRDRRGVRLTPAAHRKFLAELPVRNVLGGGVYDALIAATAAAHSLTLASCDSRAMGTYQRYGVTIDSI